jgi:hypothetical protein
MFEIYPQHLLCTIVRHISSKAINSLLVAQLGEIVSMDHSTRSIIVSPEKREHGKKSA